MHSNRALLELRTLKLITFDATGTLLQFRKPPFEVYADFGRKHGVHVDPVKLQGSFKSQWKTQNASTQHFGTCWKSWWTNFVVGTFKGADIPQSTEEAKLTRIAEELIEHFGTKEGWALKPGVEELLKKLSQKDCLEVGIISNFDPRLRDILGTLGVKEYFDFILLSYEMQMSKPSQEVFRKAANGKDPRTCLHVGDNYDLDFVGAVSSGWRAALIVAPEKDKDLPISFNDRRDVFNSLEEFGNHLMR